MNTTRISATLSTEDQKAVMAEIENICQQLPFLIDLSKTERKALPKMGDRNEIFVNKAMDFAEQHPEMFPAGFVEEMRKDAELLGSLTPIRVAIDALQKQLDDTATQAGAEAYAAARTRVLHGRLMLHEPSIKYQEPLSKWDEPRYNIHELLSMLRSRLVSHGESHSG